MNGQSTVSHPINNNEQLIGKFHVEKLPNNTVVNHEETVNTAVQPPAIPAVMAVADESMCASRFQMIRVDRNFARGRWKVNDYEPPENTSTSMNPPVNIVDNEPINSLNPSAVAPAPGTLLSTATSTTNIPTNMLGALPADPNVRLTIAHKRSFSSSSSSDCGYVSCYACATTAISYEQSRRHRTDCECWQSIWTSSSVSDCDTIEHARTQSTLYHSESSSIWLLSVFSTGLRTLRSPMGTYVGS
jgi:hypothetical protein